MYIYEIRPERLQKPIFKINPEFGPWDDGMNTHFQSGGNPQGKNTMPASGRADMNT